MSNGWRRAQSRQAVPQPGDSVLLAADKPLTTELTELKNLLDKAGFDVTIVTTQSDKHFVDNTTWVIALAALDWRESVPMWLRQEAIRRNHLLTTTKAGVEALLGGIQVKSDGYGPASLQELAESPSVARKAS